MYFLFFNRYQNSSSEYLESLCTGVKVSLNSYLSLLMTDKRTAQPGKMCDKRLVWSTQSAFYSQRRATDEVTGNVKNMWRYVILKVHYKCQISLNCLNWGILIVFLLLQHSQLLVVISSLAELCKAAASKDLCCCINFQSLSRQVGSDTSKGEEVPVLQPTGLERCWSKKPYFPPL